jgi:phosphohydrolase domain-containing protein
VLQERTRGRGAPARIGALVERLMARDLYSCAVSLPLSAAGAPTPAGVASAERRIAARLGLKRGEVLVDIPRKPTMLSTDLLVRLPTGRVVNAGDLAADDGFAMNEAQAALYAASGRVSVFTARPVALDERDVRYALEDAAIATA